MPFLRLPTFFGIQKLISLHIFASNFGIYAKMNYIYEMAKINYLAEHPDTEIKNMKETRNRTILCLELLAKYDYF